MKVAICKAFADGTPDEAHDTLHEVGHTLEDLTSLASAGEEMSAEQLVSVEQAVEKLCSGSSQTGSKLAAGKTTDEVRNQPNRASVRHTARAKISAELRE